MIVLAAIGATALWLLYAWLASAIAASWLSARKGWGEKPGLASGLLLSAVAPVAWLFVPRKPPDQAPGAAASLVMGVMGVFVFSPIAPFAWYRGMEVEQQIDDAEGRLSGRGIATAGKILGMIGTVELGIVIVILVVVAMS